MTVEEVSELIRYEYGLLKLQLSQHHMIFLTEGSDSESETEEEKRPGSSRPPKGKRKARVTRANCSKQRKKGRLSLLSKCHVSLTSGVIKGLDKCCTTIVLNWALEIWKLTKFFWKYFSFLSSWERQWRGGRWRRVGRIWQWRWRGRGWQDVLPVLRSSLPQQG